MLTYTTNLTQTLGAAHAIAKADNASSVTSQHFLRAVLSLPHTLAYRFFVGVGITEEILESSAYDYAKKTQKITTKSTAKSDETLNYSKNLNNCLEKATNNARLSGFVQVSVIHVLLPLIETSKYLEFVCLQENLSLPVLKNTLTKLLTNDLDSTTLGKGLMQDNKPSFVPLKPHDFPTLLSLGKDVTEIAYKGELDTIIGRTKELERAETILLRRTKNNPVFVGAPGSGKTALVEGLAQRIVNGEAPQGLQKKHIVQIQLFNLVAGTRYRGEFEEKLRRLIAEVERADNIILFIDEIHTIIGAGSAEGTLDASNILKPALSRGTVQVVGATTTDEYKRYVESDTALERRFQPVTLDESTVSESIQMLNGIKSYYEKHHDVTFTEEAIEQAVKLTKRYIPDRQLPDKAIDALDEAGALVSKRKNDTLNEKLATSQSQLQQISAKINAALKAKNFLELSHYSEEEQRLITERDELLSQVENSTKQEVTVDDIAMVVAQWSNIPLEKLTATESEKLLTLPATLSKQVIGQNVVSERIARTIQRARTGVKSPNKPIGSFLFLGPTGVGKTEMARTLAVELFGSTDALIRLDMSEYMEKQSVAKLIGSPPGYVGYEEGGQLTEAVRDKPYSIILFDEAEKAHPDVFNMLLQVLEEGRLTDSKGRTVDFKNTLILLTSNLGVADLRYEATVGFGSTVAKDATALPYEDMEKKLMKKVKDTLKPEFLNRLDDVLVFHALDAKSLQTIATQLVDKLVKHIDTIGINIKVTQSVIDKVIEDGTNPEYGARPLSRAIETLLENYISEQILKGTMVSGNAYTLQMTKGALTHKKTPQRKAPKKELASENV